MAATGPPTPQSTKESSATDGVKEAAKPPQCQPHKATATAAATAADTTAATTTSTTTKATAPTMDELTYHQSKKSESYLLAKAAMKEGSLEEALTILESALRHTTDMLAKLPDVQNEELHESLAPLYYLYGTTLLYSVEESDEMMANNGGQMEQQVGGEEGGDDKGEGGAEGAEDENDKPNDEQDDQHPTSNPAADGDLQVAWENLEIARSIITGMISEDDIQYFLQDSSFANKREEESTTIVLKSNEDFCKKDYSPEEMKELILDLALIHSRTGDLQRANANYLDAIPDYQRTLELRAFLGKFDRLVADAHFSLATAYAEAPKGMDESEGSSGGNARPLSKQEAAQFREKSMDHYLACGVAFAGFIANLCGEDAEKITSFDLEVGGTSIEASATGAPLLASAIHSERLSTLRERISSLKPISDADKDKFFDLKETMDEIQEAMDASENTEQALKDVAVMKANEIKKHSDHVGKEVSGGGEGGEDGATTMIGFGAPFTNADMKSAAVSSNAVPMMVVKRKKKTPEAEDDAMAKRAKTD